MSDTAFHLLAASLLYGVLGALSLVPAAFSVTMFDAPGSEKNPATRLLFWSIFTVPLACLLAIVLAWLLYLAWASAAANVFVHLPLVNIVSILLGVIWLKRVYGGRFNG